MSEVKKNSSKEVLEELSNQPEQGGLSAESIYQFQCEIEKGMEKFDMEKKQKAAQAVEDLSRLVITA